MELNQYQKEVVEHLDGPCVVTSCPGSGKTFTIVERVVRLIERGIDPKNILCITFTNKAAGEMKERICKRLKIDSPGFFIGTFHSLCANILRKMGKYGGYPSSFVIIDESEQIDLILQVARQLEITIKRDEAFHIAYLLNYYRDQQELFDWVEEKVKTQLFLPIITTYLEKCKNDHLVDFSGLIYDAIQLIEDNEEVREKLQYVFKYILVDETQDTNGSQYHLVKLLGEKWKNIMLIGDISQSIYSWRGARPGNVQQFIDEYDSCRILSLSKNYRSTPQIIKIAEKLIKHNNGNLIEKIETDNPDGESVKCLSAPNQIAEAQWVATQIKRLIEDGGWDPSDVAIFYRMNKMSEPLEQSLTKEGIPYEVIGNFNFYDRKEVKDCISMLKFLYNDKDGISFHRLCGIIDGIGDVTIGRIENRANNKKISILEATREVANESNSISIKKGCNKIVSIYSKKFDPSQPAKCVLTLVEEFDYESFLKQKFAKKESLEDRIDNIRQIAETTSLFSGEDGLGRYLQQISLMSANDKDVEGNKVSLMSFHAAKGLEFPIVFMVGVENGILPHIRTVNESEEGLEEERRLCYVGITRAKKILYMIWCKNRFSYGAQGRSFLKGSTPSVFLKEAGLIKGNDIYGD